MSDWFFWIFYYYFFQDILIILLLFCFLWFNRGYSVNNRLDFVLTMIKQDYNTNDWLEFILSFIRWENGLNTVKSSLKTEEKKTESGQNEDESQQNKKWIQSLRLKRLGSVTEAPRLGFSSHKHVFSPKTA